jgi:hypothetical protein
VDDQAVPVDCQLRLDRMLLPLAGAMGPPLRRVLRARNLLLGRIDERLEAGEVSFDLFHRPKPPHLVVDLPRERDALPDDGLQVTDVPPDVAQVEVEEELRERERDVQPVVDQQHQEPVIESELEAPPSLADLLLPVRPRQPPLLEFVVPRFDLLVEGVELRHLQTAERSEQRRAPGELRVREHP